MIIHGNALDPAVLAQVGTVDAIITDPPYSKKTHRGHNNKRRNDGTTHSLLSYDSWSERQIMRASTNWTAICRGWVVIITDNVLAPVWSDALEISGRYVFSPLPFLSPGSRVRLAGDGPSSWTCWIVVARPKHEPYSKWGTLPGGYVFPPERMAIIGGKPLSLMLALVSDYTRKGDTILDPCCGAGTTLRAAMDLGRKAIGIELNEKHVQLSRNRISQQTLF